MKQTNAQVGNSWDPEQYEKFEKERVLPFYDLINLILPKNEMCIVDLGCGTGKLTQILAETLEARACLGIDSSKEMLKNSSDYVSEGVDFKLMEIKEFAPQEKFDLVFSNAALQWVPNHAELLKKLFRLLDAEGQLAIQMPANHDYPTHVIANQLAQESPFVEDLQGEIFFHNVLTCEEYSKLLQEIGFEKQIVRMQVYPHLLESTDSLIEWVKGSLLTFYQGQLSVEKYALFLKLYSERLLAYFGDQRPFFFPIKRLFIWGMKP